MSKTAKKFGKAPETPATSALSELRKLYRLTRMPSCAVLCRLSRNVTHVLPTHIVITCTNAMAVIYPPWSIPANSFSIIFLTGPEAQARTAGHYFASLLDSASILLHTRLIRLHRKALVKLVQ